MCFCSFPTFILKEEGRISFLLNLGICAAEYPEVVMEKLYPVPDLDGTGSSNLGLPQLSVCVHRQSFMEPWRTEQGLLIVCTLRQRH